MKKKNPKFSVITPTHNNEDTITRCVMSVMTQDFKDYEHIVVDDGSTDKTGELLEHMCKVFPRLGVGVHNKSLERCISRNDGMKVAKGDWICWLDADDFYFPYYLTVLNEAIEKYPETKVFSFGGMVTWNDYKVTKRLPPDYNQEDTFKSGKIMSGGFAFKKDCLDKTGYLPEVKNPYKLFDVFIEKYPEVEKLYKNHTLGNPYGDDFAMFYMLTRYFQPKRLEITPYMVMIRGEREL